MALSHSPMVSRLLLPFLLSPLLSGPAPAQRGDLGALGLRRLGPGVMGGRIADLAVQEDRPSTFYVGTASGGLWKTVNNGTTFLPLFQHEKTVSIGALALAPSDPTQLWIGTGEANNRNSSSWGNGVYHSKDGGKTWTYRGLEESRHIGRIAIHPKNPDIVFVAALGSLWGPNPERGLYRTKDAGKTWDLVLEGEPKTGATEVRIDPENPDIVYAALYERQRDEYDGNHPVKRWGPGSGLYKSTDGGDTWKKLTEGLPTVALGRISLDIYRSEPRILYALIESEMIGKRPEGAPPPPRQGGAAFMGVQGMEDEVGGVRLPVIVQGSPAERAGLMDGDVVLEMGGKTTAETGDLREVLDGSSPGEKLTMKVLRGSGLEEFEITLGRNPSSRGGRRRGTGIAGRIGGQNANIMHLQGPNGFQTGGVYRSEDHGETWTRVNSLNPRPYYFSQIRVDPVDDNYVYVCGISLHMSTDGGKKFSQSSARGVHPDHHALWIDSGDGRHMILGHDGGVAVTYDRCRSWEVFDNLDIGQAYRAEADNRRPYWVYSGYQDNGSWGGPSATNLREGILSHHYFKVGGGDGFACRIDPEDPDVVFYESQNGNIGWRDVMKGRGGRVRWPSARGRRAWRPESLGPPEPKAPAAAGGEEPPTVPGAQEGEKGEGQEKKEEPREKPGEGRPVGRRPSSQQGGRRSPFSRRGSSRYRRNWNTPFILSRFNSKTVYFAGHVVCKSLDRGAHSVEISPTITLGKKGSATSLAESPGNPGTLWVGTDDGALWVTQNDGRDWKSCHEELTKITGKPIWVSSISASAFKEGRAYVSLDGHRLDDRAPYIFVTEDFGRTWKSLSGDFPEGSVHVVLEDSKNQDLLYAGTEFALFLSRDRGKSWTRLPEPFPTVAVRDLDIQEREGHLIIATHGRSVWSLEVAPLRALKPAEAKKPLSLIPPKDVLRIRKRSAGKLGHRFFSIPNPPESARIYYHLAKQSEDPVTIEVFDAKGKKLWTHKASTKAGLHRADWNLRTRGGGRPPGPRAGPRRGRGGSPVPEGTYTVVLSSGKTRLYETFEVEDHKGHMDTAWPRPPQVGEGGAPEGDLEEEENEEEGTGTAGGRKGEIR